MSGGPRSPAPSETREERLEVGTCPARFDGGWFQHKASGGNHINSCLLQVIETFKAGFTRKTHAKLYNSGELTKVLTDRKDGFTPELPV